MRKLSRKEAEEKMEAIFSALHYNLMDAMNAGGERTGEESYFHAEAWKVDQGRQKEDYRQTVMSLDSVGFKEYYKLVGQFATAYKIGCWKEYSECEPVLIEELGEEFGRCEKTKEKLELINSFTAEELHSQTFSFDAKIKVLQDILDDFSVGNEKEEVINRLLASFSGKDSGAFIARLQSDRKLLNGLLGRVNGGEKDRMLALLGEIFASTGFTAEQKAVSLENKATDTVKGLFKDDGSDQIFTYGVSASATGIGISGAAGAGIYVNPKNNVLHMLAASLMKSPVTSGVGMTLMAMNVEDVGGYAEVASGTGLGLSASAGVSAGVYRSKEDAAGPYIETGMSIGPIGGDVIVNYDKEIIGMSVSGSIGVSPPNVPAEGHIRFGHTTIMSFRDRREK